MHAIVMSRKCEFLCASFELYNHHHNNSLKRLYTISANFFFVSLFPHFGACLELLTQRYGKGLSRVWRGISHKLVMLSFLSKQQHRTMCWEAHAKKTNDKF